MSVFALKVSLLCVRVASILFSFGGCGLLLAAPARINLLHRTLL